MKFSLIFLAACLALSSCEQYYIITNGHQDPTNPVVTSSYIPVVYQWPDPSVEQGKALEGEAAPGDGEQIEMVQGTPKIEHGGWKAIAPYVYEENRGQVSSDDGQSIQTLQSASPAVSPPDTSAVVGASYQGTKETQVEYSIPRCRQRPCNPAQISFTATQIDQEIPRCRQRPCKVGEPFSYTGCCYQKPLLVTSRPPPPPPPPRPISPFGSVFGNKMKMLFSWPKYYK